MQKTERKSYTEVVHQLPEDICRSFQRAIVLGCWDDGTPLTSNQMQSCLEALHIWQAQHGLLSANPLDILLHNPASASAPLH